MLAEKRLYSMIADRFGPQRRNWYRIHDSNPDLKTGDGAKWIKPEEAESWNNQGWGIFHTINSFKGSRRKENLANINAWAIDIDSNNKTKLLKLIKKAPLYPSLVVETRGGYHVYWNALRASRESYEIILERLISYFGADKKVKDMARLLRVPGYYHQKDPQKPFMVSVECWNECAYTEGDMLYAFPMSEEEKKELKVKDELRSVFKSNCSSSSNDNLWDAIYDMDNQAALERLSGSAFVGGETYTFKRVSNGNHNILVNGKSTSCFIDKNQRIGSMDNGGPTVFNWLKWYGRSNAEVVLIMKEVFPELWKRN